LSYFEKVAALFLKLGTSWALHRDFAHLFLSSKELQHSFYEYLILVVRICIKVVKFTTKQFVAQITTSFTSPFDVEFNPLTIQLDQWGHYIEHKAQHVAMEASIKAQPLSRPVLLHRCRNHSYTLLAVLFCYVLCN
jgi:hypothetical protein